MHTPVGQALQTTILGILVLGGIAASAQYFAEQGGDFAVLICLAGAVGGIANNFRRLQHLAVQNWKDLDLTARKLMTLQIYLSPIVGALFAFVLNLAFMANLAQGSMFPEYHGSDPYFDFQIFADKIAPVQNVDVAKAFFWAFVAGFAEKFVPNFIDSVTKEADSASLAKGDETAK